MVNGIVTTHEYNGRADMEKCWHVPVRGTERDMCNLPARCHAKTALDPYPWERAKPLRTYVAKSPQPYPPFIDFPKDAGEPVFRPTPGYEQDRSKYPVWEDAPDV